MKQSWLDSLQTRTLGEAIREVQAQGFKAECAIVGQTFTARAKGTVFLWYGEGIPGGDLVIQKAFPGDPSEIEEEEPFAPESALEFALKLRSVFGDDASVVELVEERDAVFLREIARLRSSRK